MFRKEISNFLEQKEKSIIYIGSSNKNIDMYSEALKEKNIDIIELANIQEEEEYYRKNYKLMESLQDDNKLIVFVSLEGLLMNYSLNSDVITVELGNKIKRQKMLEILETNGYDKKYLVEKRMEYSVRGDIIDVFPLNGKNPVRLEYFGDEIDRITFFSTFDQKSYEKLNSVDMYINKNKNDVISFLELVKKITEKKECEIYLENSEIILYKLEEIILKDRGKENDIRNLYSELEKISEKIVVKKIEGDTEKIKPLKSKQGIKYSNISQIRINDYIIHENYGVGIYLGIEEIDGKDYLSIKYADEDKLFVPIEGLNKIERFIVSADKTPELYNLGRVGFKKKREKIEKDMLKFAKEIVEIQAKRSMNTGYSFSPDTIWQEEFEEKFPYIETRDQKNAIRDVKRDMESTKVMDRIICGDVGYGKTEVAIRAAFKCVMEEKQVLIMAPTTVLAQQHYERFCERFKEYPIVIKSLSRLNKGKEQSEIIKKVNQGGIDIIVGTHRVLSEELKFNNLGLIIVDEEQKFGVKDKEKLKKLHNNIDMLTLTATPIPRTLNYALLGIRDISIIETPPDGRIPIQTKFITEEDEIRDAIMKEITREGQVFYIFNRVKRIEDKLLELRKILPTFVIIEYIHGQMPPKSIKDKLKKFQDGDIDVLLSTTIIENGIDIENANTILIEGLDKLGISQVYQLRGRVGRGKRKSYCYLVSDKDRTFGKKTKERTETLKNIDETNGGFELSLEDMRIRGAGEILGEKQHGAIETFGYTLYTKMLKEEVAKVKNTYVEKFEPEIRLLEKSFIPNDYIESNERLIIYRRLLNLENMVDLDNMKNELVDRFGNLPDETKGLFHYLQIKIFSKQLKIKEIVELENVETVKISQENLVYKIKFDNNFIKHEKILELITERKAKYMKVEDALYYSGDILKFLNWYSLNDEEI